MERYIGSKKADEIIAWAQKRKDLKRLRKVNGVKLNPRIVVFGVKKVEAVFSVENLVHPRSQNNNDGISILEFCKEGAILLDQAGIVKFPKHQYNKITSEKQLHRKLRDSTGSA